MSKASIVIRISLAAILFVAGFYLYWKLIPWFLIKKPGVKYISYLLSQQASHALIFSLCLAFIPIGSLLLNLRKTKNILIASGILLIFPLIGLFVKRILLLFNIDRYHSEGLFKDSGIEYHLPLEKALPELYMFIALIIGFIALLLLKRERILFKDDSEKLEELVLGNQQKTILF